jgi:hypothetical protein
MRRLRSTYQGPEALAVQRFSLSALLREGLVLGDSRCGELVAGYGPLESRVLAVGSKKREHSSLAV